MRSIPIILAAALAMAGCAQEKAWIRHKTPAYGGSGTAGEVCPNQIPGTTVRLEALGEQTAMEFETAGDPTALRDQVQRFADAHNRMPSPPIAARATVVPTPNGARILYTPANSSDAALVRQRVQEEMVRMGNGECPGP